MSESRVAFGKHGHVGVLTMQDTQHHNALAPAQVDALLQGLERSKAEGARALVIVSADKHFCAGADIRELLKGDLLDPRIPPAHNAPMMLFRALLEDPRPVILGIDGLAMGGGLEMTLVADLVLATPRARFGLPELGLGVLPRTALARLPEIVGHRKAMELILTRRVLDAAEAQAIGLVNRLVPPEELLDTAIAVGEGIVTAPPAAVSAAKRTLGRVDPADWKAIHETLGRMDPREWREGFTAFLEKRKPEYDAFWDEMS